MSAKKVDHKAEAEWFMVAAHREDAPEWFANRMAQGQVHATLALVDQQAALVEQQRIANLRVEVSELEASIRGSILGANHPDVAALDRIKREIREGLGLS